MHEYKCYAIDLAEELEMEDMNVIQRRLNNQNNVRKRELDEFIKEQKRLNNEHEFASNHDGWWYKIVNSDNTSEFKTMHYDEDEHCMFYYLNEDDQTRRSEPFKISEMRDDSKWKRPELIKAPDNSAQMQTFNAINNISDFMGIVKQKKLTMDDAAKMLKGEIEPNVYEPSDNDELDEETVAQIKYEAKVEVEAELRAEMEAEMAELKAKLRAEMKAKMKAEMKEKLRAQMKAELEAKIRAELEVEMKHEDS